jgi:hypothetical protein
MRLSTVLISAVPGHESGEQWIRYEDLLDRDIELLEETLLYRCRLPIKELVLGKQCSAVVLTGSLAVVNGARRTFIRTSAKAFQVIGGNILPHP